MLQAEYPKARLEVFGRSYFMLQIVLNSFKHFMMMIMAWKDTDRTRKQFKQRILLMDCEDKALKKDTFINVIKT